MVELFDTMSAPAAPVLAFVREQTAASINGCVEHPELFCEPLFTSLEYASSDLGRYSIRPLPI